MGFTGIYDICKKYLNTRGEMLDYKKTKIYKDLTI